VDIGRDCTGLSPSKWLVYSNDNPKGFVYLQGKNTYQTREPVILTEDLFSAQKIRYYTGWSSLVLLGTNFKNEIAYFLQDKLPVVATDGDSAGLAAKRSINNRCDLFGIPYRNVEISDGLDPKDYSPEGLIQLFKFLGE
jgi:DNA primase